MAEAVILSLKVSTVAVAASLPFGILMAWVLVRCRFRTKSLLDSLIHLPLVFTAGGSGLSAADQHGAQRKLSVVAL